ncbi:ABC transporter permease [Corticibacter populi]|uniref:ABC transporter permease n=1 Tax=Corticibacter populi TaxID=1550736 RepID=A0A3M6QTW6_9BURK|nr:ABC transporter permease [Corticibacter populi]RMX05922.1 ABC transporter permease [Corticibacter populi]RZS30757.1 simple sugar transport system permease protein [Corticibacter populi]
MLRIEKRLAPASSKTAIAGAAALAVIAALLVCAVLFALQGANPLQAYASLFSGGFGDWRGIGYTLNKAAPLALIALGTIVAWRCGFAYLGFEGCFVIGAAAATAVALAVVPDRWLAGVPFAVFLPICIAAAMLAGALWAASTGWLRARFGGSEVLMSLMGNYIALLLVQYLVSGPMRAPGGLPQSARIPQETWLPLVIEGTRAHAGIGLALLAALLVWVLLRKTPLGYEMVVAGLNPLAARNSGIAVGRRVLQASLLAGALAALAGLVQVLGVQYRLLDGMSGGIGFIGIVVALLARLHPLWVLPVALLYGGMSVGADSMQRATGVPTSITFILQALTVLFVLASPWLLRYRVVWQSPRAAAGRPLGERNG